MFTLEQMQAMATNIGADVPAQSEVVENTENNVEAVDTNAESVENIDISEEMDDNEVDEGKPLDTTKPRKNGYKKKIEKLSTDRDYWKQRAEEAENNRYQPQEIKEVGSIEEFDGNWDARDKEFARTEARKIIQEERILEQQQKDYDAFQDKLSDFDRRVGEVKAADLKDWDTVVQATSNIGLVDGVMTAGKQNLLKMCVESDIGERVIYELAKDKAAFEKLTKLNPIEQARAIGRAEGVIKSGLNKALIDKASKTVSKAPPPIEGMSSAPVKSAQQVSNNKYEFAKQMVNNGFKI